jgi:hypothetical protein
MAQKIILPHESLSIGHRRTLSVSDVPDTVWPSDNDLGIPVLKLNLQADALDMPFPMWGTLRRSDQMFGTWGFYVDDYRFSGLWTQPHKLINTDCVSTVECNFTIHDMMPRAVALFHIYRKRWLARYWQEMGNVRIFADLNVSKEYYEDNMIGIPQGWRSYCTRGYEKHLDDYPVQFKLACERANVAHEDDVLFIVYGGGRGVKEICIQNKWIWAPEQQDKAQKRPLVADMGDVINLPNPERGQLQLTV